MGKAVAVAVVFLIETLVYVTTARAQPYVIYLEDVITAEHTFTTVGVTDTLTRTFDPGPPLVVPDSVPLAWAVFDGSSPSIEPQQLLSLMGDVRHISPYALDINGQPSSIYRVPLLVNNGQWVDGSYDEETIFEVVRRMLDQMEGGQETSWIFSYDDITVFQNEMRFWAYDSSSYDGVNYTFTGGPTMVARAIIEPYNGTLYQAAGSGSFDPEVNAAILNVEELLSNFILGTWTFDQFADMIALIINGGTDANGQTIISWAAFQQNMLGVLASINAFTIQNLAANTQTNTELDQIAGLLESWNDTSGLTAPDGSSAHQDLIKKDLSENVIGLDGQNDDSNNLSELGQLFALPDLPGRYPPGHVCEIAIDLPAWGIGEYSYDAPRYAIQSSDVPSWVRDGLNVWFTFLGSGIAIMQVIGALKPGGA